MDIFSLLDTVQATARNGLQYASNDFDRDRYERLLNMAVQSYAEVLHVPEGHIRSLFLKEMGIITPKVGSDAAIFNEQGEILLMDRADGTGWCLPCGWVEANEKPVEAVVREVREETGLMIEVKRLVGVFTRKADAGHGPHTMIAVVHLCEVTGGTLALSHEGLGLQYWSIGSVPKWHATHERYAREAYDVWKSGDGLPALSD